MSEKHLWYLADLCLLLVDYAKEAKRECRACKNDPGDKIYQQGRIMAYYEVLSLIRDQAKVFELPLTDFKLDKFDIEKWFNEPE